MRDELIRVLTSLDFHYQVHTCYTVVFEFDALFHRLASQQLLILFSLKETMYKQEPQEILASTGAILGQVDCFVQCEVVLILLIVNEGHATFMFVVYYLTFLMFI